MQGLPGELLPAEAAVSVRSTTLKGRRPPVPAGGSLPRMAFVLSQFPQTHETFILREFVALEAAGLDFVIFSLKACKDKVVQREAGAFLDRTYYPWDAGVGVGGLMRALRGVPGALSLLPWARAPLKTAYVSWAAQSFSQLAGKLGISHLHAHWATAPTSAAAMMSRTLNVPFSFTAHAWDIFTGDGKLSAKARAAEFIITCTGANVGAIRSTVDPADAGKVILNYHGIPAAEVTGRSAVRSDVLRIAAVGRLVETKGFAFLLEALAIARFPFELTIVGDGPLRGSLEKMAAHCPNGSVRFAGLVPNERVFDVLRESDCFVMPSVIARSGDRDGIPNVMLEAMAVGTPVVASDLSGIPEAVVDGRTGILVQPGDSAGILSALEWIDENPQDALALGSSAARLVREKFNAEKNAASLYCVFARHLKGRAS